MAKSKEFQELYVGERISQMPLPMARVGTINDVKDLSPDVQRGIRFGRDPLEGLYLIVESESHENGIPIKFGSVISWRKLGKSTPRCPHGIDIEVCLDFKSQINSGNLKEINGKFYRAKSVALPAELFSGKFPEILSNLPMFDDQVLIECGKILIQTPNGTSHCYPYLGFIVVAGIFSKDPKIPKKFWGNVDVRVLTPGTPTFDNYCVVDRDGTLIESLSEFYNNIWTP